jgi:hypothetical protein
METNVKIETRNKEISQIKANSEDEYWHLLKNFKAYHKKQKL